MGSNDAGAIKLIVNADDLGEDAVINAGVVNAAAAGILTSSSLMAVGAAFDAAVALLDDLPTLGIGVHLTLAGAKAVLPVGRIPSLCQENGDLPKDAAAFARRYYAGVTRLSDVRAELSAQIEKVLDAGVRPTHLDSHQHLHNLPGVAGEVLSLAERYKIKRFRSSRCSLWPPGRKWLTRQVLLRLYAESFAVRAAAAEIRLPSGTLGQQYAGVYTTPKLVSMIKRLKPGNWELMCHPGTGNVAGDPPYFNRARELAAITAPVVREALEGKGVRLINFAAL